MCPDWGLNPKPLGVQDELQPTQLCWLGNLKMPIFQMLMLRLREAWDSLAFRQ